MKVYLFQIKTKGKEQIFIHELENKRQVKIFIEINYPKTKLTVFLIKEVVLVKESKGGLNGRRNTTRN